MLDHPKWLMFAVFVFGLIHSLSNILEAGEVGTPTEPTGSFGLSFGSVIWGVIGFDYAWMDGDFVFLRFVLLAIQWTIIVLVARDVLRLIRGV